MAKRKVTKKAKRRLAFFGTISIALIVYCLITFVNTAVNFYTLKTEEKQLTNELKTLKSNASDLKTEINKLQDKDYVARYARENYLYTKNGEYVIKTSEKKTKQKTKKINDNQDYIIYGCILATCFIILFIIFKHRRRKKK